MSLNLASDNPILLEAVKRISARQSLEPMRKFLATYKMDPVAFAHDCFNWKDGDALTAYQDDILAAFAVKKRISVRGPRGLGKTMFASMAVLWFVLTREIECTLDGGDWKVPTTAGVYRQLSKFLWPEIHKWAWRLKWSRIPLAPFDNRSQLLNEEIKLPHGSAFAMASDRPELIEGAHADHVLCLFDESKAIPAATFDSAEGIFHGSKVQEGYAVAVSTPGDCSGRFYEIQSHKPGYDNWWVKHVTLQEVLKAGRITQEQVDQHKKQWGEDNPIYQAQVLGEFPKQGADTLISLSWVDSARNRELVPLGEKKAGVDVARWGSDDSVELIVQDAEIEQEIAKGACVMELESWNGHDLMQTAGRVKAKGIESNIDSIGVGAGVFDRLQEQGFVCNAINVGEGADDSEHFANKRAELYWKLREDFRDGKLDLTRLTDSDYDRLSGELVAIKYEYRSNGQIKIEDKDEMKKRLSGNSPDYADALMLTRSTSGGLIGINLL